MSVVFKGCWYLERMVFIWYILYVLVNGNLVLLIVI